MPKNENYMQDSQSEGKQIADGAKKVAKGTGKVAKFLKKLIGKKFFIVLLIIISFIILLVLSLSVIYEKDVADGVQSYDDWLESEDEVEYE